MPPSINGDGCLMKSFPIARKRAFMSAIALVSLAFLILLVSLSPVVKAQDNQLEIQLSPASGPEGTPVSVYGLGFSGGTVTISFNSQQVATANPEMFGRIDAVFMVPSISQGVYTVTATTYHRRHWPQQYSRLLQKAPRLLPEQARKRGPVQAPERAPEQALGQGRPQAPRL